ncbi:hypothetical protein [Yinghuangia seranimata]|uniref:hypothetical protein n=1 Tax=Yinghuangia seranimata TaxID=408067 RepID=UPI00248BA2D5|nr:hypothetical protein [Yinghuangia seranimata]MDI2129600.1 hypothetical protein [Yinghuangia seranimata]
MLSEDAFLALPAALRLAPPRVADALAERFRPDLAVGLGRYLGVADAVAGELLAEEGIPGRALFDAEGRWNLVLVRRAVRSRRVWREPDTRLLFHLRSDAGLVRALVDEVAEPDDPFWDPLVEAMCEHAKEGDPFAMARGPFPKVTLETAIERCAQLPVELAMDLCVEVARRCGRAGLRELTDAALGSRWLHEQVAAAVGEAEPVAYLLARRRADRWGDPDAAAQYVRAVSDRGPAEPPDDLPPIDWGLIRHEIAREEDWEHHYPDLTWFTAWEDCPADLRDRAFSDDPALAARRCRRPPVEVLAHPALVGRPAALTELLRRCIREGWFTVDRLTAEGPGVATLLAALPREEPSVRDALTGLAASFGTDPTAWVTLYATLGTFTGPAVALPHAVARAEPVVVWPDPEPAAFPLTAPEGARAAFVALLAHASEETRLAVVPHLDQRAAQHLLVCEDPAPRVRAALLDAHCSAASSADVHALVKELAYDTESSEPALVRYARKHLVLPWDALLEAVDEGDPHETSVLALAQDAGHDERFAWAVLCFVSRLGRRCPPMYAPLPERPGPEFFLTHVPDPVDHLWSLTLDPNDRDLDPAEPCAAARALTDRYLGTDVEAWTIALGLVETFTGTLPELLATARAAAGGGGGAGPV